LDPATSPVEASHWGAGGDVGYSLFLSVIRPVDVISHAMKKGLIFYIPSDI